MSARAEAIVAFSVPEEYSGLILVNDELGAPSYVLDRVPPNDIVWAYGGPFNDLWHV